MSVHTATSIPTKTLFLPPPEASQPALAPEEYEHRFLQAIADDTEVAPYGADFEDGYRASEVCDAIVRSGETGARETNSYRSL